MKKQILFLAFFVLAALFSVTNTYGQSAIHHSNPRALDPSTCLDDPLHPLAGIPYDYGVGVSPTGGTYQWIVTDQPSFMTGGALTSDVLTVTTDELLGFSNATSETSTITWTSKILQGRVENPATLFVGVKYDVTVPCSTNNFKVYPIVPFKAFTVDLLSLDPVSVTATVTYGGTTTQCYDAVQSATYNPTANVVDYNFGTNILYYEMVAANFVDNYMPSFQLSGLSGTQSATVEWDYTTAFGATTVNLGTKDGTGTLTFAGTTSATTTEPSTGQGVSIFVRVTISNNSWEGIADNTITLAANGVNTDGENDIPNDATDTYNTCAGTATYDDIATQVLSARPDVTTAFPAPGLIPNGN